MSTITAKEGEDSVHGTTAPFGSAAVSRAKILKTLQLAKADSQPRLCSHPWENCAELVLDTWETEISSTAPYRFVQPDYFVYSVPRNPPLDEPERPRDNHGLLVDTLVNDLDRYRVAADFGQVLYPGGGAPETLIDEMKAVRDYGFDHIIVIGEFLHGMFFLDCYGRVFAWDDASPALWLCGNSVEEAKAKGMQCKRMGWELRDGKVHEFEDDNSEFYQN
ncbi:hypothetical protein BC937DRAFT_91186 [Endogone sp. FLAS-F59071]|nr:hypothetical protein BC937DRAFT_91186 [Endogone sp. FLAS-F59071]|eukprot:RUS16446.1 hypothetical protein BC937DRAFT_91186 [Endogone sp. FLAS-F59071]